MVLATISSIRHIHFNIEIMQYLYTGVKGNTLHTDLFFLYLCLDALQKQTLRGWGHWLQLEVTFLQTAWCNMKKPNFQENNIREAFLEAWVFPIPPTAEDSERKRVSVSVPRASAAFSPCSWEKVESLPCS